MSGFPKNAAPLCAVQVKTRAKGSDGSWVMRKKHEGLDATSLYYCFVDLAVEPPVTFVIPAAIVARTLTVSHQAWLDQPGAKGQQRRDGDMRRLRPSYGNLGSAYQKGWLEPYREAWHFLGSEPG